jgi:hypothetical protein
MDRTAVPSQPWHFRNAIEPLNQLVEMQVGLRFNPNVYGVVSYVSKIELANSGTWPSLRPEPRSRWGGSPCALYFPNTYAR